MFRSDLPNPDPKDPADSEYGYFFLNLDPAGSEYFCDWNFEYLNWL